MNYRSVYPSFCWPRRGSTERTTSFIRNGVLTPLRRKKKKKETMRNSNKTRNSYQSIVRVSRRTHRTVYIVLNSLFYYFQWNTFTTWMRETITLDSNNVESKSSRITDAEDWDRNYLFCTHASKLHTRTRARNISLGVHNHYSSDIQHDWLIYRSPMPVLFAWNDSRFTVPTNVRTQFITVSWPL